MPWISVSMFARRKMRRRDMPVGVLDQVEMLDQKVAPARPVAQKGAHLIEGARVDLAPLGGSGRAPPGLRVFGNYIGI